MNKDVIEFLDQNVYNLTPEEYNAAVADLQQMDNYSWGEKYNDLFSNKTVGWRDVKNKFKPVAERLTNAFGTSDKDNPFKKPKNFVDDVYQKDFSDMPRELFDQKLQQQSNYWDDFKKEREREAGITRREQEVKNWSKQPEGWYRNLLTSDYEKQRYINEPEQALFGNEAPLLGDAPKPRWGSIGDLGLGGAALATDIITSPTKITPIGFAVNALAGPGIRTLRDIGHKVTNSPYQKEGGDIFEDFYKDAALNAGTMAFANARRFARGTDIATQGKGLTQTLLEDVNNIEKGTNELSKIIGSKGDNITEIINYVDNMPNSPLKNDLMGIIASYKGKTIDKNVLNEVVEGYKHALKPTTQAEAIELMKKGELPENKFLYDIARSKAPTKMDKLAYKANKLAQDINASKIGTILTETTTTLGGARDGKPKRTEEYDKNWFKQNYTRDWLLNFKPDKKDQEQNTPKWQAYKEWYFDKYGEMPKEDF